MKWHSCGMPARAGAFATTSWTRFSPMRAWPRVSALMILAGSIVLVASNRRTSEAPRPDATAAARTCSATAAKRSDSATPPADDEDCTLLISTTRTLTDRPQVDDVAGRITHRQLRTPVY